MKTLNNLPLFVKLLAAMLGTLLLVLAINDVVFVRAYEADAQEAMTLKAAAFTATADEAKNHAARLVRDGSFDSAKLLEEAKADKAAGKPVSETKLFRTVPVVVGWTAAREAAKREGLEFKVVAFDARNKANEPGKGSFTETLLKDLTAQVRAGGKDSLHRVDTATNQMHYVRALKLDESCMSCHGDPGTYDRRDADGKFDGLDVVGYPMEGWKVGDMHGAFEVVMPMSAVDSKVAGFVQLGLTYTLPVVLGGMVVLWLLIRALLNRPVARLIGMFKEIATGDGDLTRRLKLERGDEVGQLAKWFDTFLDNVHGIIKQVVATTSGVAAASTEIAASSEEMASGLKLQGEQTTQVSAAVEEMSQTVTEVAQKSAEAAKAAHTSETKAQAGGEIVGKTVSEIRAIAQQVSESASAVGKLGKKSEEIGHIIAVINDIAEQTNLLALNAAIEAARAGEHGRGFAVVADEVRKLAERTTQATDEVSRSIREIQTEMATAVGRIQSGNERVSTGVELAEEAGASLREIVEASAGVQGMVRSIAAASEEQSAASTEIAKSVERINAVTREANQGALQAAEAAGQLSKQAETLRSLVGRFKV